MDVTMTIKSKVYLIGAGPGDPELITLKANRILKKADVIFYDKLTHPNLLSGAPQADCIYVGKAKGHHSKKQSEINALMKKHANNNKIIVRLKGGDPMVFGRAGEEMEFLRENKIPYEIVPGVSSALAVPAYAGIPITHRDHSRSFAIITGTLKTGGGIENLEIPDADTLVFLMGVTHLNAIINALLARPKFSLKTPVAIIQKGTTSDQKTVLGCLSNISELTKKYKISHPSIIVIGKVAKLAKTLSWWEKLPLSGKRVILLRTLTQSQELTQALSDQGAEVIQYPLLNLSPARKALEKITQKMLSPFTMLIFTSPNAVEFFLDACRKTQIDARAFAGKEIISIGPKTTQKLNDYGLIPDKEARTNSQEGIISSLHRKLTDELILIPASKLASPELAKTLETRGATTVVLPIYTNTPNTALNTLPPIKDGDIVLFTSSSTADNFYQTELYSKQKIHAIAIGPITQKTILKYQKSQITVSKSPKYPDIIKAVGSIK